MRLVANNLAYSFDGENTLWKNVNFDVGDGELFSLLGSNGIGKSTMLRCLIGFYKPFDGDVKLVDDDGTEYNAWENLKEFTEKIGYVPQIQDTAYSFQVRDYIVMGRAPHLGLFSQPKKEDYEITDEVMHEMGIYEIRNRLFNRLSGGQQRQAVIARAIVQQPKMIIMDEPTNHLDYGNQFRVLKMIEKLLEKKITVVLTTHMPDQVLYLGGRAGILKPDGLQSGPAKDVLTESSLKDIYKVGVRLIYVKEAGRYVCIAN